VSGSRLLNVALRAGSGCITERHSPLAVALECRRNRVTEGETFVHRTETLVVATMPACSTGGAGRVVTSSVAE
jgi:hypothetical protein